MAGKPQTEEIAVLKERYLEYYRELPVQRYAAAHIARSEDTIITWRSQDPKFADDVEAAKASWVKKKAGQSPPNWVLERLEREIFAPPKQDVQLTGDPVKELLKAYGIEGNDDATKTDEPVQGTSKSQT